MFQSERTTNIYPPLQLPSSKLGKFEDLPCIQSLLVSNITFGINSSSGCCSTSSSIGLSDSCPTTNIIACSKVRNEFSITNIVANFFPNNNHTQNPNQKNPKTYQQLNTNIVLATSSIRGATSKNIYPDRKSPYSHLTASSLISTVVRSAIITSSQFLIRMFDAQTKNDKRIELLYERGILTEYQMEEAKGEWTPDWSILVGFPKLLGIAVAKSLGVNSACRGMEYCLLDSTIGLPLLGCLALWTSDKTKRKLVKDNFNSARRKSKRGMKGGVMFQKMFKTYLYGTGCFAFSSYMVDQIILGFGITKDLVLDYRRTKLQLSRSSNPPLNKKKRLILFLFESYKLQTARLTMFVASGFGAAVGSVMLPGYGTFLGSLVAEAGVNLIFE